MSRRLAPQDLTLLGTESATTPLHNATIAVFETGGSGMDYQRLLELIADRIAFVPRYRQRVLAVPGRIANPLWVDDADFDLGFHVRRSALPKPGSSEQLLELVSRIIARPLDRAKPLWEAYVVEGLADGRVALLTKSHQILVDGVQTVDVCQVLLDTGAEPKVLERDEWQPRTPPTPSFLVIDAVRDSVERPAMVVDTVRGNTGALLRTLQATAETAAAVVGVFSSRRPVPDSPVTGGPSQQRRFVGVRTSLADHRAVRAQHGGTVNDVILATVAGALRGWLMARTESLGGVRKLRALVPMSVIDDELEATSLGTQVVGHLVDLPIGEASPVVRLHQVSYSLKAHGETGRAVAADRLARIAGFAPSTFHALGSRLAASERRTGYHLSVTNVPGPQFPLYAAGSRMLETYPCPPLLPGHALAIGVTSYDGSVYYGLTADRDALPDAEVLGQCLAEALDELVDTTTPTRPRAPRGGPRPRP